MKATQDKRILITGGCGYVGSILVPKLAQRYHVTVIDSMFFGNHLKPMVNLTVVQGDIRNSRLLDSLLPGITDVIHLASISNDPSSELDPSLTYAINRDAVKHLVNASKRCGVQRFINASSSSVYGVKEEESVTEYLSLEPITLYAKMKAETEEIVGSLSSDGFTTVSIRSATVCGYSPRMRFDLIVNIMTKAAMVKGLITVHGGNQYRPNIHIEDITDLYALLVEMPVDRINGKVFNVGSTNYTVNEIAQMTREETGASIEIKAEITDNRSYRISSEKIKRELRYEPKKTVRQGIRDIKKAFDEGKFPNPENDIYYNVKIVKDLIDNKKIDSVASVLTNLSNR